MSLFEIFLEDLKHVEGGYVNDPSDSGGETNYGITKAVARNYGYTGNIKDLPYSLAAQIYKEKYWDVFDLDRVGNKNPALAMKLADIGVNMGTQRAGYFIQRLLNVMNDREKYYADLKIDGIVGKKTHAALNAFLKRRGHVGEMVLVRGLNCLQGAFYVHLAEMREKDEKFIYGWFLNRID